MDEQTFWDLVDRLGPDPADVDRLVDELSDLGAADIRDFADHLARALHALDTPAHYRAVAASGASFLGVRCAAVAAGATAYRRVLSAPATLASYADRPGAQLLPVAERAFRTSTRGDWQHRPEVGTHTGANAAAWAELRLYPSLDYQSAELRLYPSPDYQSAELRLYPSLDYQSAELRLYPSLDYQSAELGCTRTWAPPTRAAPRRIT